MKLGITRLITMAAIAALVFVAASTTAWAAQCSTPAPSSPTYSPDFTSNQACMTTNGSASFPIPAGSAAMIASWSGASGIVTFQAPNSFVAGEPITLSGFGNSTFFNGLTFGVLAVGLSNTQFEIAFSGYSGSSDTGTATPLNVLQLTPNSTGDAGSAWYNNTEQSVTASFSTTFTFQLSNPSLGSLGAADGIAFVIQNSTAGTSALGPDGCGMGFADGSCTTSTGGIPNSLAVDFKTYNDGYPSPNNNSVSIVSYGTGANCVDQACNIAYNNSLLTSYGITLADGNTHTATISYTLQPTISISPHCFSGATAEPCLDVILDGHDLFSGGVALILNGTSAALSLQALIGGGNNAWVGFTAGTGGGDDYQDILSWTFTPQAQSQTASVSPTTPAVYGYNGGCVDNGNGGCTGNGYSVNVAENPGSTLTINNMVVTPIPIIASSGNPGDSQALCNSIVDALNPNATPPNTSPWVSPGSNPPQTAQCFVYTNGGGQNVDAPVMFAVTCPPSGVCDTTQNQFLAALASYFTFTCVENPPLIAPTCSPISSPSSFGNFANLTSTTGYPSVGFLQGAGPDPNNPCNPATGPNAPPLFQTNQVVLFTLGDTTSKPVKGGSGLLTSCWVATYDTPGEMPTATVTSINGSSPTNGADYPLGSTVPANFTCTAVSTDPDSILDPNGYPAAGPYLTVSTCSATSGLTAGGGTPTNGTCTPSSPTLNSCSGAFNLDTSETGPHTLSADVEDSATNTAASQAWTYYVGSAGVTVGTNPAGLAFSVDGINYTSAQTLTWGIGSPHTLSTTATQTPSAGTQDVFTGWSDGTSTVSDSVTAPATTTSYTANFSTSYQLTTAATTGGTVSPTSGSYYPAGTVVSLTATASPGYVFTGWTGPVASASNSSTTVTMNAPESVTANFSPTVQVTIGTSPAGLSFSVDGTSYTSAQTLTWTQGTSHSIATTSPQTPIAGTQYTFSGWSDGGALVHSVTAPTTATTYTASFTTSYQLTTAVIPSGGGIVTPASGGYYTAGTSASLTATPAAGYVFSNWTASPAPVANANLASTSVTLSAPETVTANFVSALTVSPSTVSFGTVNQGTLTTKVITLTNSGQSIITMSEPFISIVKGQSSAFLILSWCPKSLQPGGKCEITVSFFAGAYYSPQTATLYIMDNAPGNPQPVTLTATVVDPQASLSANSLNFGTQKPGSSTTKPVTLKNTGGTTLSLNNITVTGSSDFTLTASSTPCGSSLSAGSSCIINVTFKPTAKASYSGTLQITDNSITGSTQSIPLTGAGN
jgi:uncharacterized repeat protein (TIGR02543 family)